MASPITRTSPTITAEATHSLQTFMVRVIATITSPVTAYISPSRGSRKAFSTRTPITVRVASTEPQTPISMEAPGLAVRPKVLTKTRTRTPIGTSGPP